MRRIFPTPRCKDVKFLGDLQVLDNKFCINNKNSYDIS